LLSYYRPFVSFPGHTYSGNEASKMQCLLY